MTATFGIHLKSMRPTKWHVLDVAIEKRKKERGKKSDHSKVNREKRIAEIESQTEPYSASTSVYLRLISCVVTIFSCSFHTSIAMTEYL